jgi:Ni/Co efflux regulator RcnB
MKRILAVIVFFAAAATSLALGQTADKQEKTKGDKSWLRLVDHLYFVVDHDDHHLARIWELVNAARREHLCVTWSWELRMNLPRTFSLAHWPVN